MDIKQQAKKSQADKLKSYGGTTKPWALQDGSLSSSPSSAVKTGSRKGYASGGIVDGGMPAPRMDRAGGGGGSKKGGTVVNVIVAGKDDSQQQPPMAPPMPPPAPQRVPIPMPVPGPQAGPGGPPMGGPGMMPPGGGGLPMHARGGRVGYKSGGKVHSDEAEDKKLIKKELHQFKEHPGKFATGGTVGLDKVKKELPKAPGRDSIKGEVSMDGGGGGGLGRLEKCRDYGKRSS